MTYSESATAGVYLHIPFCSTKCSYCDFASWPCRQDIFYPYGHALVRQIDLAASTWQGPPLDTLYVGGGTPTVLPTDLLVTIISQCLVALSVGPNAEVTCEANPGTVSGPMLAALAEVGVNRLSLGAQSMQDDELALLGRIHRQEAVREAVQLARGAGIANISLDLIYGLPGQTPARWRHNLEQALALAPEHLSLYALTLEPGTPLAREVTLGRLPAPDDDCVADMYLAAQTMLAEQGYVQYEISNWALGQPDDQHDGVPRLASRHNLHYWRNEQYLGLGCAAYSFDGRHRFGSCHDPDVYIQRVTAGEDVREDDELISPSLEMDETMMLGLRLVTGVRHMDFAKRFDASPNEVYRYEIRRLQEDGLLTVDRVGIRLAPHALLVANRVMAEFLRDR
ncbi:MAG: radical SAM family heme chaperone HemW [Anaerolineae bacterium]|nr:radical SAM family heme chaperone HemW [Chloroflexota bacterium]